MVSIVLRLGLGLELGLAINVRCGCLSQDRVNFKKKMTISMLREGRRRRCSHVEWSRRSVRRKLRPIDGKT